MLAKIKDIMVFGIFWRTMMGGSLGGVSRGRPSNRRGGAVYGTF